MKTLYPEPLNLLSEVQLVVLERYIETLSYPKDTAIFMMGDEPDGCYIIDSGLVRIETENTSSDPDDRDDILAFIEAGSILGELSLLDSLPRSASAFAHSDVTARRISADAFKQIANDFPRIGLDNFNEASNFSSHSLFSSDRLIIGQNSCFLIETS